MSGLGDNVVATVTYNGFAFADPDALAPPNVSFQGSPVYDETGRTVLWTDWALRVSSTVWAETEADAKTTVGNLRNLLETPGKRLELIGLGFGDVIIEDSKEINRGVKPRIIGVTQVAGYSALEVEWECTFSISQGSSNVGNIGSVCEFAYDLSTSIDEEGVTTRTITGFMRQTSDDGKSADEALREKLEIIIPSGFRRMRQEYSESRDKTRLDFAVVDVEQTSDALPKGCTKAQGRITWATSSAGFSNWAFSVNASITVAPDRDPKIAGKRFFEVVQLYKKSIAAATGATIIPRSLSISPGLWLESRTTQFSMSFFAVRKLSDLFAKGSIWHPYSSTGALSKDWDGWQKSVDPILGSKSVRGNAGLIMPGGASNNPVINVTNIKDQITLKGDVKKPAYNADSAESALSCEVGDENYIGYRLQMRLMKSESVSRVARAVEYVSEIANRGLQFAGVSPNGQTGASVFANVLSSVIGKIVGGSAGDKGHYIETHGEPHSIVLLEGLGMRVGTPPAKVTVSAIGGKAATPLDQFDVGEELVNYFGCSVYIRRWWTLYDIDGDISGYDLPVPKNPANR